MTAQRRSVEARLWEALRDVEDPEIPISVVGMGLIVSLAYRADERAADLRVHLHRDGLPGDGLHRGRHPRARCWPSHDVDEVEIEVVWDPVWTESRIRDEARETMRGLGIVA